MRRTTKVSKKDFLVEDDDDLVGVFTKDKRKQDRRRSKEQARQRRQQIKEQRYEDDWN